MSGHIADTSRGAGVGSGARPLAYAGLLIPLQACGAALPIVAAGSGTDARKALMSEQNLYFDDLKVGDTFDSSTCEVTAADIKRFAGEFDPQPFHLDETAAQRTVFGGLAASGWHTAALTMRLLVSGGPKLANGIVGAGGEIEWKLPTRPGDVLRVQSEVLELVPSRSRPDRGAAVLRCKTLNQADEVVQVFTARLLVERRLD